MRKYEKAMSGILAVTFLVSTLGNYNFPVYAQDTEEKPYILVMEDQETYDEVEAEVNDSITVESSVLSENNIMVAELTEGQVAALERNDQVLVEEDIIVTASAEEDTIEVLTDESQGEDSGEAAQQDWEWNLRAINADGTVSEESSGEAQVKVAVLDSGVDFVEGIELAGWENFVEDEEEISLIFQDLTGHGTGIASIIGGNKEGDIQGVNPNAQMYSVKVLDEENCAPLSRIIQGIYWCIENEMDIINMSFGTTSYSRAFEQAVEDAYGAGILMVASAGNDMGSVEYPAAFDEVMAVAATAPDGQISEFSNTGEELDIAAPGEKIRVAGFFNGHVVTHGTSIAVPHVTGVASLLWEKDLTKSNEFIRQLIDYSAREIEGTKECGLLDAEYALFLYDAFEETFQEGGTVEEILPENTQEPENFEYIEEDEAYVEGRWGGENHKNAVEEGNPGFSEAVIKIIKKGAVYPDTVVSGWQSGRENPRWHGKWLTKKGEALNYVSCYELITHMALKGGDVSSFTSFGKGLATETFGAIKRDIKNINYSTNQAGNVSTAEDKKYFLWGCALHTITDALAHATTRPNGELIGHGLDNGTKPDDINYYTRRYKVATKITQYSLENLKKGTPGNGQDIIKALNNVYLDKADFKIIRIKKYVNENGYSAPVLDQATISDPK